MGAGKDTAADHLQKIYPFLKRASFALRVKEVVATLTGTRLEDNMSREGKASWAPGFDVTLGRMQQLVGEGLRQVVCEDVWIRSVLGSTSESIVITDVRYPNEVEAILRAGGMVLRIKRDTSALELDGRDPNHPSETALDDFPDSGYTAVIHNDGPISRFLGTVDRQVRRNWK